MKKLVRVIDEADLDKESMFGWMSAYFANKPKLVSELKLIQQDMQQMTDMTRNATQLTTDDGNFYQNSLILKQFDLVDEQLIYNICYLIVFAIMCRLGAYFALKWRASSKHS